MRDCKNCIHRTKNGCDSWDCEFEKRMPNEEAIKVLEMVEVYGIADRAKRAAICALKNEQTEKTTLSNFTQQQTTDGDLISRQSVITMLQKIENAVEDGDGFQFNEWIEYAKDIPGAEKTAVFKTVGNTTKYYECSKCDGEVDGWDRYCKHCGARLVLKGVEK